MTGACIVLTTVGSKDVAERMARELVDCRLAACVNVVGPIRSIYRWKEQVENEEEFLLLIKTTTTCLDRLRLAMEAIHPYELPEFAHIPIEGGSEAYLAWLSAGVGNGR